MDDEMDRESDSAEEDVLTPAEILDFIDDRRSPDDVFDKGDDRSVEDLSAIESKVLSSRRAWEGSFLKIDDVEVELPNGKVTHHIAARHPGAVAVIALDDQGRILLVNQYRTAIERVMLEIPAGKLEPGEDATECALRELEEETGYRATCISYLIPMATAPGYSDEIIHLFMATGLERGHADLDEDEFIAVQWMDMSELIDLTLDGKIEDAKTIVAALVYDAMAHRMFTNQNQE